MSRRALVVGLVALAALGAAVAVWASRSDPSPACRDTTVVLVEPGAVKTMHVRRQACP